MADSLRDTHDSNKKTLKNIDPVSHFPSIFQNDHHAYCARKAERLATAVHVVTSFVPRDEPLRPLLRSSALEIVRLSTDRARLVDIGPETYTTRCAEIGSLLSTAEGAGLISQMNAKLIIEEYARLAEFVRDRYTFIRIQTSDVQDPIRHSEPSKGHVERMLNKPRIVQSIKDIDQRGGRQADILALFNTKDKISVKDAVQAIPGVSEKTLQRDLLALVAQGVLIKEGERRWSIYRKAEGKAL